MGSHTLDLESSPEGGMCISSQRDAHMHVTECLEHIRQFIKWFIKWFAKSCAFVVLVLKISSSGRKWFKIGIVQSLGLVYFWKGICVPSTAGDCDLVGDTVTCRELCMQSVLLAATSTGACHCRVTGSALCLTDHFVWHYSQPLCSSLVMGPAWDCGWCE